MLDIKFIRENKKAVEKNCKSRNIKCDIDKLLDLDEKRKKLVQEMDELNAEKNKLNDQIQKAEKDEKKEIIDIEKHFKKKTDVLMDLNASKLFSPVILIEKYLLKKIAADYLPLEIVSRVKQAYRAPDSASFLKAGKNALSRQQRTSAP